MKKEDVEKLVQCLNALEQIQKGLSLSDRLSVPGLPVIIEEGRIALKNNPDYIPDWYSI